MWLTLYLLSSFKTLTPEWNSRHFQMHSLERKCLMMSNLNFTQVSSWRSNVHIGWGDGLPLNRQITITSTKDEIIHWHKYITPGLNELTHCGLVTPYGNIDLGQHWLRWWLAALLLQAKTWINVDSWLMVQFHRKCVTNICSQKSSFEINIQRFLLICERTMS